MECPSCYGPVEYTDGPCMCSYLCLCTPTALPDTLEGIGKAMFADRGLEVVTLHSAVRRMFNGCILCGREPMAVTQAKASEIVRINTERFNKLRECQEHLKDVRRQAFQQASGGLRGSIPDIARTLMGDASPLDKGLEKLLGLTRRGTQAEWDKVRFGAYITIVTELLSPLFDKLSQLAEEV